MTEPSPLEPSDIRMVHDDTNRPQEVAKLHAYLQSIGLEAACRHFIRGGGNMQRTWLCLRSHFDISYGEFKKTFEQVAAEQ